MEQDRLQSILNRLASISVIVASASVIWLAFSLKADPARKAIARADARGSRAAVPQGSLPLANTAILGRPEVRVGVVEFTDFQCPFCSKFAAEVLPSILTEYVERGRAFIGFRHLPLERIHPFAFRAAQAAECGRRQKEFLAVHNLLFTSPKAFGSMDWQSFAVQAGLDPVEFNRCLKADSDRAVRRDIAAAHELGIRSTPTFVFGVRDDEGRFRVTRLEAGAIPLHSFAAILDELITTALAEQIGAQTP